jgi:hypothetical protein
MLNKAKDIAGLRLQSRQQGSSMAHREHVYPIFTQNGGDLRYQQ